MIARVRKLYNSNALLANSINLMASAGFTALFGFVFWLAVAHGFKADTVGVATTLLSVSSLISLLGLAGFDTILVRFLSHSKYRNDHINGGLIISGSATTVISVAFCFVAPYISPHLAILRSHPLYAIVFVAATIFGTWNIVTNAALVAYRRTAFVVGVNIIFSAIKMLLPFVFHGGGPMTIFVFAGVAQIIGVVLSISALVRYFDYAPSWRVRVDVLKKLRRYGLSVYAAHLLNLLPDSLLPLIVINKLGAAAAAYFYISFTVVNLLYTIAFATTQSLLAEASHDEANALSHSWRSIKIITTLLVPASVILFVGCPYVLVLFGHGYSHGATSLLRIFILSSLVVMLYAVLGTMFKLHHKLRAIVTMNAVNAVVIVGASFFTARHYGLNAIGWAWLAGNVASVAVGLYFARSWFSRRFAR